MIVASWWDGITTIVMDFVSWAETAVVFVFNLVISGIGVILSAAIAALPAMPTLPVVPGWIDTGMQWGSYYFPIPFFLTTITTMFGLWVAWLVIRVVLRWGKANPE
jgi:hypothetical protein